MKKLAVMMICIILLTGCSTHGVGNVAEVQEQDDGTVRVLYYYIDGSESGSNVMAAVKMLQVYGKENNIEIEVTRYTSDELGYEDYVMKRNTMIQNNEADIVFDEADELYDIRDRCGEYSKLDTYRNIWDNLKGYYCIPLYLYSHADKINDAALESYDIPPEKVKDVLTRQEYYEIKQLMKEKGARFALNKCEIMELAEYYITKNNMRIRESDGRYTVDKDALRQTISEVYEDIKNNYDEFDESNLKDFDSDYEIRDEVTGEIIRDWHTTLFRYMSNYGEIIDYVYNLGGYEDRKSPDSSIFIDDIGVQTGRNFQYSSLFIRKNSADEVYKAASILFTGKYYKIINPISQKWGYSPVIDTP